MVSVTKLGYWMMRSSTHLAAAVVISLFKKKKGGKNSVTFSSLPLLSLFLSCVISHS